MQKIGDQLVINAHDLISVLECDHRNLLNKLVVEKVISKPDQKADANLELIKDLGLTFEKKKLKQLIDEGKDVITIAEVNKNGDRHKNYLEACLQTIEAMKKDPDIIYQGVLYTEDFLGYVDFLVIAKNADGSVLRDQNGLAIYEPADTKLARTAKKSAVVQVAVYAEVMTRLGLSMPEKVHLWLGSGEELSYRTDDVVPLAKHLFERIKELNQVKNELPKILWAEKRTACDMCIWKDHCENARKADDDISLVYNTRVETRKKLRAAGLNTIEKLANSTLEDKPSGISIKTFEKLTAQALIQYKNKTGEDDIPVFELVSEKELSLLPPRSKGDVWFDMEGDPHALDGRGLEYLFGLVHQEENNLPFVTFGASNQVEEKRAFENFIDWILQRFEQYPDMHIYHYANYENTTLKRLAMNYETRQEDLDTILKNGLLVDLFKILKKSLRFSTSSLSLKKIEKVYGRSHKGDVATASDSIIQYEHIIKLREENNHEEADRILQNIYDYNEVDCQSTKELDDWLRKVATDNKIIVGQLRQPEIFEEDYLEDDEEIVIDPVAEKLELLNTYLEGAIDAKWDEAIIRGLEILIGSINYHKQEKSPTWWQHFERVKSEEDELIDDNGVVFIEDASPGEWTKEGKQRSFRRLTHIKSNGYGLSDVFSPGEEVYSLYSDELNPIDVLTLSDSDRGYYKAKVVPTTMGWAIEERSKAGKEGWPNTPIAVLPGPPIDTKTLTKVLLTLADQTISRLEEGNSAFGDNCWADIAMRRQPRNLNNAQLPRTGDDVEDCVSAIENSDNSYVAVQGPPGSGKTYLGTRVIKRLIELGYKIGIVAQSHAVIENVLDKLYELDSNLPIAKKQHSDNSVTKPWHTDKIEVFASLQNKGYAIGGTSWNFAREAIKELDLDLMVIEEAGQFALANTLIVSSVAKKTLLLGDPQQLAQVSQASHKYPVDKSALGHILDNHKTIPDELGYFLSKTYRMHSKLTKPVSKLQYENRLKSAPETDERDLEDIVPGLYSFPVMHSGNTTRSDEEAVEIIKIVNQLIGKTWTNKDVSKPLEESDILIVAAYNNQVRALKQTLKKNDLKDIRVGTVDKFQGQEAPISIVSMATSSGEDLPRGIEFLLEANRLNVAISRAQWASFIVHSPELLNINPTSVEAVERLGAFIGLVNSSQIWQA